MNTLKRLGGELDCSLLPPAKKARVAPPLIAVAIKGLACTKWSNEIPLVKDSDLGHAPLERLRAIEITCDEYIATYGLDVSALKVISKIIACILHIVPKGITGDICKHAHLIKNHPIYVLSFRKNGCLAITKKLMEETVARSSEFFKDILAQEPKGDALHHISLPSCDRQRFKDYLAELTCEKKDSVFNSLTIDQLLQWSQSYQNSPEGKEPPLPKALSILVTVSQFKDSELIERFDSGMQELFSAFTCTKNLSLTPEQKNILNGQKTILLVLLKQFFAAYDIATPHFDSAFVNHLANLLFSHRVSSGFAPIYDINVKEILVAAKDSGLVKPMLKKACKDYLSHDIPSHMHNYLVLKDALHEFDLKGSKFEQIALQHLQNRLILYIFSPAHLPFPYAVALQRLKMVEQHLAYSQMAVALRLLLEQLNYTPSLLHVVVRFFVDLAPMLDHYGLHVEKVKNMAAGESYAKIFNLDTQFDEARGVDAKVAIVNQIITLKLSTLTLTKWHPLLNTAVGLRQIVLKKYVSGRTLKQVARHPTLESLIIKVYDAKKTIDKKEIEALRPLKTLRHLEINHCVLPPEQVLNILPQLEIFDHDYCDDSSLEDTP